MASNNDFEHQRSFRNIKNSIGSSIRLCGHILVFSFGKGHIVLYFVNNFEEVLNFYLLL